jgi:predicted naringenin-chalcone synthase
MQAVYAPGEAERRKLRFLYQHCGIDQRYSVVSDYSRPAAEWKFYPQSENLEPFPGLEQRMALFNKHAPALSVDAIRQCLNGVLQHRDVTHLITVTCTGLSAPGLDLQVMELMDLPKNIIRTSVNFMGCYAAIHALKLGDAFCRADAGSKVLIVCTELCTLHFQREGTVDNIASSLLFGDGAAAVLMTGKDHAGPGLEIKDFYSEVLPGGKRDMAWELSATGFIMTLSGYVPELIEGDFGAVINRCLQRRGWSKESIDQWCIHPGGKRILEAITRSAGVAYEQLAASYQVLQQYGNMSSATILFVLQKLLQQRDAGQRLFGAAFGPGLTVETFTAEHAAG